MAGDTTEIAVYDEAGRLSKVSRWSDGQKHGKWEAFYPDGKPWSVHQYHHGVQVGGYFTWHPNGKPFITGQYDSIGHPTGMWRFFDDQRGVDPRRKRALHSQLNVNSSTVGGACTA